MSFFARDCAVPQNAKASTMGDVSLPNGKNETAGTRTQGLRIKSLDGPAVFLEESSDSGPSAAHCAALLQNDPELAEVAMSWSSLPRPVKVGIVAMVRAATCSQ